jgi:hypothetical protein
MLRIEPRFAFINSVLLANRVLIFRFHLLAVYVLLVHNCGECRIGRKAMIAKKNWEKNFTEIFQNFFLNFFLKTWLAKICKAVS